MANSEDGNFDFGDLDLPNDDLPPLDQPLDESELPDAELPAVDLSDAEPTAAETPVTEPTAGEAETAATETPAESTESTAEATSLSPQEPRDLSMMLEYGLLGLGVVALLIFGWLNVLPFSMALYVISIGLVGYGIWKGRQTNTVYTVFVACALLGILTALYCLWLELGRYQFEVKAKNVPRTAVSQTFDVSRLA